MAKVSEFFIHRTPVSQHLTNVRYEVRKQGYTNQVSDYQIVAACTTHYRATQVLKALTEQAKRDPLRGIDVQREYEHIYQGQLAQRARDCIAEEFAAGRLSLPAKGEIKARGITIRTPEGVVITTRGENGSNICTHKGGSEKLTITIK